MTSIRRILGVIAAVGVSSCAGAGPAKVAPDPSGSSVSALDAVTGFGANPGNLLMFRYAPAGMPSNAPLVVVLHGCEQGATDMVGAGWNAIADLDKFYVVYPQQQSANNPSTCFDWFGQYNNPADKTNVTRGGGEDESIKEMVDKTKADYSVDASRVFVAGFSSGAAMVAVLLSTYPDVFAGGGINSGIPYGCPMTSNSDVFTCMNPGKPETAAQWGQAAIAGDPGFSGPYPRASIWQGTMDFTVATANETEMVKQWTDVHGLSQTPTTMDMVAGFPHATYADMNGNVQVESYQITGMGHGMATDPSSGCGTAGQYSPDEHICTALYMAKFFGLSGAAASDGGTVMQDSGSGSDSGSSGSHDAGAGGGGSGGSGGGGSGGNGASPGSASGEGGLGDQPTPGFAGCSASGAVGAPTGLPLFTLLILAALVCGRRRNWTMHIARTILLGLASLSAACLTSVSGTSDGGTAPAGDSGVAPGDPTKNMANADAIVYRDDLSKHPGCTTAGLSYPAAQIQGYSCAAKDYPVSPEDPSKPIVLLVHGNSSTPGDWEVCKPGGSSNPVTGGCVDPSKSPPMLSERLVAAGYHAIAVDSRIDMTTNDPNNPATNDAKTGNAAHNIDHGWDVPIVSYFIEAVMAAYPTRQISIVSFSLGPTVVRDALRRLHRAGKKPFERIDTLVYASGAHHGVSTFRKMCGDPASPANITMAGTIACEMGDRTAFQPTAFDTPLNGPNTSSGGAFVGAFETPCLDGDSAFGQSGVCGGHKVRYTTVVMQDPPSGALQDEFVSQSASALNGADNQTVTLADQDQTGYFYNGAFKNHFGSIRSEAGLTIIMSALTHK